MRQSLRERCAALEQAIEKALVALDDCNIGRAGNILLATIQPEHDPSETCWCEPELVNREEVGAGKEEPVWAHKNPS